MIFFDPYMMTIVWIEEDSVSKLFCGFLTVHTLRLHDVSPA